MSAGVPLKEGEFVINIMGRPYIVKHVDKIQLDGHDNPIGAASYGAKEILLKNGFANWYKKETLAHEIAHCILCETGLEYFFDDRQREAICEIALNVYRTFVENNIDNQMKDV